MKFLMIIPIETHRKLLDRCEINSADYELLNNGVRARGEDGGDIVFVLCETIPAHQILARARELFPPADSQITMTPAPQAKN